MRNCFKTEIFVKENVCTFTVQISDGTKFISFSRISKTVYGKIKFQNATVDLAVIICGSHSVSKPIAARKRKSQIRFPDLGRSYCRIYALFTVPAEMHVNLWPNIQWSSNECVKKKEINSHIILVWLKNRFTQFRNISYIVLHVYWYANKTGKTPQGGCAYSCVEVIFEFRRLSHASSRRKLLLALVSRYTSLLTSTVYSRNTYK